MNPGPHRRTSARPTRAATGLAVLGLLVGCGSPAQPGTADDDRLEVLTSFYPLQYMAEQVGGDVVHVENLTPFGADPHDLDLSPRRVRMVGEADLVVYLSGFQPAVDEAVAAQRPDRVLDAATVVTLREATGHRVDDHTTDHEEVEHAHGVLDPHFWLDPTLLAELAAPVAELLGEIRPEEATGFTARADALRADLAALDEEIRTGLADCERDVVVVAHAAFGYLTDRYDLRQVGLSGLDPEAEPSPARLRQVADIVRSEDVTTIFFETLVNPKVARTLAEDLGIGTDVLDPLEGLVDETDDYRSVMERNLAALEEALGCA